MGEKPVHDKRATWETFVWVSFLGLAIGVGLFFRLYKLSEYTGFTADQNLEFIIDESILDGSNRLLVGPTVGIPGFYSPPTYYYLSSLFLWLVGEPNLVAYFFVAANLISALLVYLTLTEIKGKRAGYIGVVIMMLSSEMVGQSRFIYPPHLQGVFFWAGIYLMIKAQRINKLKFLVASIFAYSLAMSIYVAAVVLVFWFGYFTLRFFKRKKFSLAKSLVLSLAVWTIVFGIVYLPQLMFEVENNWISLGAIGNFSTETVGVNYLQIYLENWVVFWRDAVLAVPYMYRSVDERLVLLLSAGMVWLFIRNRVLHQDKTAKTQLVGFFWVILGSLAVVLYPDEIFSHRLVAFVPFTIISLALLIDQIKSTRDRYNAWLALTLVVVLVVANVYSAYLRVFKYQWYPYFQMKNVAGMIADDAKARKLSPDEVKVIAYDPGDYTNYGSLAYLYWLGKSLGYPAKLNKYGNDIEYSNTISEKVKVVYLMCHDYGVFDEAGDECLDYFKENNPKFEVEKHRQFEGGFWFYVMSLEERDEG